VPWQLTGHAAVCASVAGSWPPTATISLAWGACAIGARISPRNRRR